MAETYEEILVERKGSTGIITLNRPDRRNAFTWRLGAEMHHAFGALDADEDIRAIVVTGAGKYFCAGADLETGGETFGASSWEERKEIDAALKDQQLHPWEMSTPIIGAINGAAVGVGITLPLQWDIRIAAEDAKLGFIFNRRGVMPEAGSMWFLPRLIGTARAMELFLTGKIITGAEAAEIGLVSKAVPANEVLPAALELADQIASETAPMSAALTKKLLYRFLNESDPSRVVNLDGPIFQWVGQQEDAIEGITAFLEKRPPEWKLKKNQLPPDDLWDF